MLSGVKSPVGMAKAHRQEDSLNRKTDEEHPWLNSRSALDPLISILIASFKMVDPPLSAVCFVGQVTYRFSNRSSKQDMGLKEWVQGMSLRSLTHTQT